MIFWIAFAFYFIVLAVSYAKLEISIEGKFGYAERLPCRKWKLRGPLKRAIGNREYLSEYHVWMIAVLLLFFHMPLWFTGWSLLRLELFVMGLFVVFLVVEDFLWFLLNPHYGLRRFKREHVWWHPSWLLGLPSFYWTYTPIGALLMALGFIL